MRGTIAWDDEAGWTVTDEYGDWWQVLEIDGAHGFLVREDSQRYYGAEWAADSARSESGDLYERREGDTYEGLEALYEFDPMRGWVDVTPAAE
jgi:hypothetical protein